MQQNAVETVVGGIVIVVAAAFFVFAYKTAGVGAGAGGYRVSAQFERIDGVSVGTDVRLAGIKIGSVVAQDLDQNNYEANVTFAIDPSIRLPDDSTVKIASEGLLGGNYVLIEAGGSETMLADGGQFVHTQSSVSILDLIGKAIFGAAKGS